jgi:hypothetical protein
LRRAQGVEPFPEVRKRIDAVELGTSSETSAKGEESQRQPPRWNPIVNY